MPQLILFSVSMHLLPCFANGVSQFSKRGVFLHLTCLFNGFTSVRSTAWGCFLLLALLKKYRIGGGLHVLRRPMYKSALEGSCLSCDHDGFQSALTAVAASFIALLLHGFKSLPILRGCSTYNLYSSCCSFLLSPYAHKSLDRSYTCTML
jgi:hypothetical protein